MPTYTAMVRLRIRLAAKTPAKPTRVPANSLAVFGIDHVVLFGEYDSFGDLYGLDEIAANGSFEWLVVEMPEDMELDEMIDALGHVEDSLELDITPRWNDEYTTLCWTQDDLVFQARLDGEPPEE